VGFEPTISAGERPQTHALDRAAILTSSNVNYFKLFYLKHSDFLPNVWRG
jgi:hypothetical protein